MGVCDSEGREAGTVVWCTALYSSPEQQASSVRQSQTGLLFSHYNNCNTGVNLRPRNSLIMILTQREGVMIFLSESSVCKTRVS